MNRRSLILATLALLVAGVVAAVVFSNRVAPSVTAAPGAQELRVGDVAPPFAVASTAGYFDSSAGKGPILLEVFATWCPHCRRETTTLNALWSEFRGKVRMIAVDGSEFSDEAQTIPESQANVARFAEQFKVAYPLAYDPGLAVAQRYYAHGFPTIVVIDRNGRVASVSSGESTLEDLRKRLRLVL